MLSAKTFTREVMEVDIQPEFSISQDDKLTIPVQEKGAEGAKEKTKEELTAEY